MSSASIIRICDGDPGGSAVVFASPGLWPQAVLGCELANRDSASCSDEFIPVGCQCQPMFTSGCAIDAPPPFVLSFAVFEGRVPRKMNFSFPVGVRGGLR